jgi:hypothetical protein
MKHDFQILKLCVDAELSSKVSVTVQATQKALEPSQWNTASYTDKFKPYIMQWNSNVMKLSLLNNLQTAPANDT